MEDVFMIFRAINIALGLICFVLSMLKASTYWSRYSVVARAFTSSMILFALAATYGTAEQHLLGFPPGPRAVITTAALSALFVGLWKTRGRSYYIEFASDRVVKH